MLTQVHPKLPMRDKSKTQDFYEKLGFKIYGSNEYDDYLMLQLDHVELHFFMFKGLDIFENYGQIYLRTNNIHELYESFLNNNILIHPNGKLELKPWGIKEFSLLDPDKNLLTFGEANL